MSVHVCVCVCACVCVCVSLRADLSPPPLRSPTEPSCLSVLTQEIVDLKHGSYSTDDVNVHGGRRVS